MPNIHCKTGIHSIKALFGGTFDPPHYGHLLPLKETADITGFKHISLLVANVPVFKKDITPATHRIAMATLFSKLDNRFDVDLTEFQRDKISYTIDTLMHITAREPSQKLVFIIGLDSLLTLHLWERYQTLFDYCHILVMLRPTEASETFNNDSSQNQSVDVASKMYDFYTTPHEFSNIVKSNPALSQIVHSFLLSKLAKPENDSQCINQQGFKDIIENSDTGKLWFVKNKRVLLSSTAIREHIRTGKNINKLVPASVHDYIIKHRLYHI